MPNRHLEQAGVLLAEAGEGMFVRPGAEPFEERLAKTLEYARAKREEALIHAVLAVAEEIAAHRKVLAGRR